MNSIPTSSSITVLMLLSPDYARTLREWRRRFEATFETEIVPALREAYPELTSRKGIDTFRRKWICRSLLIDGARARR